MTNHLVSRQKALAVTAELEQAITEVLEKHGLDAPNFKTTYGDRYVLKVETTPLEEGEGGVNLNSPEAQEFKLHAAFFDMSPTDLGQEFQFGGETFVLLGYISRRPKYPFVARKVSDGRNYKLPEAPVRAAFAAKN